MGATERDAQPLASWDCKLWPANIWPNDPKRALWILRMHRAELLECGALTRIGKRLVVLGPGYRRFLNRHIGDVTEFQSNLPARRASEAAERSLKRAARAIGVIKEPKGFRGNWHWALPPESCSHATLCTPSSLSDSD